MKKVTLLVGLFSIIATEMPAQELESTKINGKYGFVNSKGKVVISPKYDFAGDFSEGLASVELDGKYGYINTKGATVIPILYQSAGDFVDGMAKVMLDLKYCFIDKTGKQITPAKYDEALDFDNGFASVSINKKWGIIDSTGKEVIPIMYEYAGSFNEGLAAVQINDKVGYIDVTNKVIIPAKYDFANEFKNGVALVSLNGRKIFIDKSGVLINKEDDRIIKKVDYKYGFADASGKMVISPKYAEVREFKGGMAAVKLLSFSGWDFIDAEGNTITQRTYDGVSDFINGVAMVNINSKYGFINTKGDEIIPVQYFDLSEVSSGVIVMLKNSTKYYFYSDGRELSKNEIEKFEKDKAEKAGVAKQTILGNMVIEKKIDESGTILTIDNQPVNLKFTNYKNLSSSGICSFDIEGRKIIYYKSGNKAIKCGYTLSTYDNDPRIVLPDIPWPGETTPVPEIVMKLGDKLTVINAFNSKTITLPFQLIYKDSILYKNEGYAVSNFVSHANIEFKSAAFECNACDGHGYIRGEDKYETITKTTYENETVKNKTYNGTIYYTQKKVPVTKTEKVLKRGELETCKKCNGAGVLKKVKYIHWDGIKLSE